jgi:hypothetical protein
MAAHKGRASLRPRCTRSGSSVAAIPVYKSIHAKASESYPYVCEREREYTVNIQCSVQYTLLLLYLMLVMAYCA